MSIRYRNDKRIYFAATRQSRVDLKLIHCSSTALQPWKANTETWNSRQTHREWKSSHGTVTLHTRHNRRIVADSSRETDKDKNDELLEILEASIAFLPNHTQAARIAVAFQQSMYYGGSTLKHPILTVSVLLPDDSKVFQLIKNGDLEGLIKALSLKEVRLNDRDSRGRCLLNVRYK